MYLWLRLFEPKCPIIHGLLRYLWAISPVKRFWNYTWAIIIYYLQNWCSYFMGTFPIFPYNWGVPFNWALSNYAFSFLEVCPHSENTSKIYYPLKASQIWYPPIDRHLVCFCFAAVKKNTPMNFHIHTHLSFVPQMSSFMFPSSGIAVSQIMCVSRFS